MDPYVTYSIIAAIVAIVNFFLGLIAYLARRENQTNRYFAFICFCLALWPGAMTIAYLLKDPASIMFWTKMSFVGPFFIPPAFYTFILAFPNKRVSFPKWQLFFLWLPSFIFLGILPSKLIERLGWKSEQELNADLKNDKLIIQKENWEN